MVALLKPKKQTNLKRRRKKKKRNRTIGIRKAKRNRKTREKKGNRINKLIGDAMMMEEFNEQLI